MTRGRSLVFQITHLCWDPVILLNIFGESEIFLIWHDIPYIDISCHLSVFSMNILSILSLQLVKSLLEKYPCRRMASSKYYQIFYLGANNKAGRPANLVLPLKMIYFMTLLERRREGILAELLWSSSKYPIMKLGEVRIQNHTDQKKWVRKNWKKKCFPFSKLPENNSNNWQVLSVEAHGWGETILYKKLNILLVVTDTFHTI